MARRRSSVTACSRPSGSRYRALPATRTLAPAAAARPTVSGPMPPSTSTSTTSASPAAVDHPADLGDLRLHRGEVPLAAEARVDGHHEHEVDEVEHVGDGARRRRRVERDAGAGARARRSRRACGGGAGTPRRGRSAAGTRPRRSGRAITSGVSTIRWASNGTRDVRPGGGDDVGPERQVGHELAVHDVPLDEVDAGLLERRRPPRRGGRSRPAAPTGRSGSGGPSRRRYRLTGAGAHRRP